jgi:hypothetical protein
MTVSSGAKRWVSCNGNTTPSARIVNSNRSMIRATMISRMPMTAEVMMDALL